jgi:hypothetical protein
VNVTFAGLEEVTQTFQSAVLDAMSDIGCNPFELADVESHGVLTSMIMTTSMAADRVANVSDVQTVNGLLQARVSTKSSWSVVMIEVERLPSSQGAPSPSSSSEAPTSSGAVALPVAVGGGLFIAAAAAAMIIKKRRNRKGLVGGQGRRSIVPENDNGMEMGLVANPLVLASNRQMESRYAGMDTPGPPGPPAPTPAPQRAKVAPLRGRGSGSASWMESANWEAACREAQSAVPGAQGALPEAPGPSTAAARRDSFWDPPTKPAMSSADDPQPATVERTETGNDSFWNGTSRNERSASALRRASDTPSIMSSIEEAKPIQDQDVENDVWPRKDSFLPRRKDSTTSTTSTVYTVPGTGLGRAPSLQDLKDEFKTIPPRVNRTTSSAASSTDTFRHRDRSTSSTSASTYTPVVGGESDLPVQVWDPVAKPPPTEDVGFEEDVNDFPMAEALSYTTVDPSRSSLELRDDAADKELEQ